MITNRHSVSFWGLQIPGWLLLAYLIYAQGITAFSYNLGVSLGTQEPAEIITEVGTAFWYGFAFGDLMIYIPVLLIGLIGHFRATEGGVIFMAAALGITVYWPVVCLTAIVDARTATGWNLGDEAPYWVVLPVIALWGAWGLSMLVRMQHHSKSTINQSREIDP
ncbi:MAG: hypothetical protein QNJ78_14455 [Gammaproteobacteria bacterium]|nr:hypothetical protein [Gammaproteobacteria bacterium]